MDTALFPIAIVAAAFSACGSPPLPGPDTRLQPSLRVSPCFSGEWDMTATLDGPIGTPSGSWGTMRIVVDVLDGGLTAYGMCPDGTGEASAIGQAYTAGGANTITCVLPRHEAAPLMVSFRHAGFIYVPPDSLLVNMVGTGRANGVAFDVTAHLRGVHPANTPNSECR